MSLYRPVRIEFWKDPKVIEEMTPEDKLFFLYLLTNPNTTQIGIYRITKKQMAFDLGYSVESVSCILDRFVNIHKVIMYNEKTREVAIKNWGKHGFSRLGKPVMDCVRSELKKVDDVSLIEYVLENISNECLIELYKSACDDRNKIYDTSTIGTHKEEKENTYTNKDINNKEIKKNRYTKEDEESKLNKSIKNNRYSEEEAKLNKDVKNSKYIKDNRSNKETDEKNLGGQYSGCYTKSDSKCKYAGVYKGKDEKFSRRPSEEELRLAREL